MTRWLDPGEEALIDDLRASLSDLDRALQTLEDEDGEEPAANVVLEVLADLTIRAATDNLAALDGYLGAVEDALADPDVDSLVGFAYLDNLPPDVLELCRSRLGPLGCAVLDELEDGTLGDRDSGEPAEAGEKEPPLSPAAWRDAPTPSS
ncbi:MAG: hypothetical protein ACRDYD_12170 [Acidimicrobiales bacterium]